MKRFGPVAVLILTLLLPTVTAADEGIDGGTNIFRASNGLPALATDSTLTDLAAQRAVEIAQEGGWHHDFWWWGASGCNSIGENIAYRVPAPEDPSAYAVNQWINSAPHQANMLGDWDLTGSAIYFAPNGGTYAAQLFGADCSRGTVEPEPDPAPAPPPSPPPINEPPAPPPPQTEPVLLPDTAMRSPCLTSRTLCPSLNRMTGTSFPS